MEENSELRVFKEKPVLTTLVHYIPCQPNKRLLGQVSWKCDVWVACQREGVCDWIFHSLILFLHVTGHDSAKHFAMCLTPGMFGEPPKSVLQTTHMLKVRHIFKCLADLGPYLLSFTSGPILQGNELLPESLTTTGVEGILPLEGPGPLWSK